MGVPCFCTLWCGESLNEGGDPANVLIAVVKPIPEVGAYVGAIGHGACPKCLARAGDSVRPLSNPAAPAATKGEV